MKINQKQKRIALYALAPLLGASMLGGVAFAASTSTQPTNTTGTKTKGTFSMPFGDHHGHRGKDKDDITELSNILGMTTTDVQTALDSGKTVNDLITSKGLSVTEVQAKLEAAEETEMKTRLTAAVTSGKITQVEADQMVAERAAHEQTEKAELAQALGITTTDLDAYKAAGKTIDQIITEKGLTKATVMATLAASHQAEMKTNIQERVASGKITQAQADSILAKMANHVGGHSRGDDLDF